MADKMTRDYILNIFPGIEKFWDLDAGKTVMEVYFRVQEQQLIWKQQWNTVQNNQKLEPCMALSAADVLLIGLQPYELDGRKPFPDKAMQLFNAILDGAAEKRQHIDRITFLRVMDMVNTYKIDRELNGLLMAQEICLHLIRKGIRQEEGQKFEVQVETGEVLEAEMLAVIEVDDVEYAVYLLPNEDGFRDILASYVKQDEEGFDMLVDITNPADKAKVDKSIKDLIRQGKLQ